MIYRILVTPEIKDDPFLTSTFKDEDEMNVEDICDNLSYYIVTMNVAYEYKDKMLKALKDRDHIKFYKYVEKTAKKCRKELE